MSMFVKTIMLVTSLVLIGGCSAKGFFVGVGMEEFRPELPNVAVAEQDDGSSWLRTKNIQGEQRYHHSATRTSSSAYGDYEGLARD